MTGMQLKEVANNLSGIIENIIHDLYLPLIVLKAFRADYINLYETGAIK